MIREMGTGREIRKVPLSPSRVECALEDLTDLLKKGQCEGKKIFYLLINDDDRAFALPEISGIKHALEVWIPNLKVIRSLEEAKKNVILQVLFMGEKGDMDILEEKWASWENVNTFAFPSIRFDFHYLEIRDINASKGKALEFISNDMGVNRDEVLAIGDFLNDIEMFEYAGYSATLAHAPEKVKECVDFIASADNENGGLAEIINELVL